MCVHSGPDHQPKTKSISTQSDRTTRRVPLRMYTAYYSRSTHHLFYASRRDGKKLDDEHLSRLKPKFAWQ